MKTKHITEDATNRIIRRRCKQYLCGADRVGVIGDKVYYLYNKHPQNSASDGKWVFAGFKKDIITSINREIDYLAEQN